MFVARQLMSAFALNGHRLVRRTCLLLTQSGHSKCYYYRAGHNPWAIFGKQHLKYENEEPAALEICYLRRDHKRDYGMVFILRCPFAGSRAQCSASQAWPSCVQKRFASRAHCSSAQAWPSCFQKGCAPPITTQLLSLQRSWPPSVYSLRNLLQHL